MTERQVALLGSIALLCSGSSVSLAAVVAQCDFPKLTC